MSSLDNLLPSTVFRALVACVFVLAMLLYFLRGATLSKTTDDLRGVMYDTEWIYYRSAEAGLLGQCDEIHQELSQ